MSEFDRSERRRLPSVGTALLSVVPVVAAALVGNLATIPNLVPWYAGLTKPWFNPPNWVFGPAWTTLYVLMALAFWRILRQPADRAGRTTAIAWFLIQITLNAVWSIGFFGLHSPLAGLGVIALLLPAIAVTLVTFHRIDRPAGLLLTPYLLWVCFATVLNTAVWSLNR